MKKRILLILIPIIILCCAFVLDALVQYKHITDNFPMNDKSSDYFISCSGSMYSLNIRENQNSDISGLFVGSSPVDLRNFCEKDVSVYFSLRFLKGNGICIEGTCRDVKSPIIDIQSIEEK